LGIIHSFMRSMMSHNLDRYRPRRPKSKTITGRIQGKAIYIDYCCSSTHSYMDRKSGELLHSSSGQIIITANWLLVDGALYPEPKNPSDITNKNLDSHQKIWNFQVDVDKGQVLQVAQQADRVVTDTARSDLVRANVNMFIPKTILIQAGTEVRWSNPLNFPIMLQVFLTKPRGRIVQKTPA
jgi:hypothetical protein